jgi:nucleotide-binding universal stress UspA family protein
VAKQTGAVDVTVVQESDVSKMALMRSEELTNAEAKEQKQKMLAEEKEKLAEILDCAGCEELKVNIERKDGKPGYVITQYAREHKADVLVLNSPDTKLNFIDRMFPHDIEYALADLPCDLLIVHSRVEDDEHL